MNRKTVIIQSTLDPRVLIYSNIKRNLCFEIFSSFKKHIGRMGSGRRINQFSAIPDVTCEHDVLKTWTKTACWQHRGRSCSLALPPTEKGHFIFRSFWISSGVLKEHPQTRGNEGAKSSYLKTLKNLDSMGRMCSPGTRIIFAPFSLWLNPAPLYFSLLICSSFSACVYKSGQFLPASDLFYLWQPSALTFSPSYSKPPTAGMALLSGSMASGHSGLHSS